jgi:DNA repair protein SbcC/Rad50
VKPVRLSMRAFGPYTHEQVLDFRLLGDQSFFLIHGPTGAGKSTLLDAVCFALYGETSGGERHPNSMRSDHADPETLTEVTFDFSLAGALYRITRCPEQERIRKRGGGSTRQRPTATLWKRAEHMDDSDDGTVLAAQWSRVTEEVERLLGFRSEQFRQVVMLPQGQFQKFLLAGSRDREQILEVLFQTEFYRFIEEALKESAKSIKTEFDQLSAQVQLILKQAAAESREELQTVSEEQGTRLERLREYIQNLRAGEKEADEALNVGMESLKKIAEVERATKELETLRAREPQIQADRLRLEKAGKALAIRDVVAHAEERRKELEAAVRRAVEARKNADRAAAASQKSQEALTAEMGRENLREETRRRLDQLLRMRSQIQELAKSRKDLEKVRTKCKRLAGLCDGKAAALEQLRTLLRDEVRPAHERARQATAELEGHRLAFQQARRLYRQITRYRIKSRGLSAASQVRGAAAEQLREAQDQLVRARRELDGMETRWIEGQAAILAKGLTDGAPCPVCGSTHHPFPALGRGDLPTDASLKKARRLTKDLETGLEKARVAADRAHRDYVELEAVVRNIPTEITAAEPSAPSALKRQLRETHRIYQESRTSASAISRLEEALAAADRSESQLKTRLDHLEEGKTVAEQRRDQLAAVLEDRTANIPVALRQEIAIEKHVAQTEATLNRLNEALEKTRKDHESTVSGLAASREALENARDLEKTCEERLSATLTERDRRVREAGFADLPSCISAMLAEKAMKDLDGRIRGFHEMLQAARDRLDRAQQTAEGVSEPNVEALRTHLETIRDDLTRSMSQQGALLERIRQMNDWLRQLAELGRAIEEREHRFTVVGRIADAAAGKNAHRITFQRFVLATFLDGVLETASRRLRIMSKGRFDLERARQKADQRSAAGLDLLVYDSYTGTTRPVNTLSGGESFLASLALALGLADVVQAYAGGVRLETIFVDEGFGSLDPEALDLAFQTLLDLREGNRLVGIISHVPELKERIDVRLEVTQGRHGSSARFCL